MLGIILILQALTVAVAGPPRSPEYLPLRVAESGGHFARRGLDATLRVTRSEAGAAQALAEGQVDLAATSLEAVLRFGHRPGRPAPRLVFALTAAPPVALLVSPAHADRVRAVMDLAGGRIGLASPGTPEQTWLLAVLARARIGPTGVTLLALGRHGVAAALASGAVDAAVIGEPGASVLAGEPRAPVLVDLRSPRAAAEALGAPSVNAAVFMRGDRPVGEAELVAFAQALLAAEQTISTETPTALAARLPRDVVGLPTEWERRVADLRGLYLPDGLVGVEAVRRTTEMIGARLPLPREVATRRPAVVLHLEPLRRSLH